MNTYFFDFKKAVQSLNYIAYRSFNSVGVKKSIKLIYFINKYHLRKYGYPVFKDSYVAMKQGIVPSITKSLVQATDRFIKNKKAIEYRDEFIQTGSFEYKSKKEVDWDVFSETEIEALKIVCDTLGQKSTKDLIELTHMYPEWNKYEKEFQGENPKKRIDIDTSDFFRNPNKTVNDFFKIDRDQLKASKEIFQIS